MRKSSIMFLLWNFTHRVSETENNEQFTWPDTSFAISHNNWPAKNTRVPVICAPFLIHVMGIFPPINQHWLSSH